ncbi:MAG TPA: hypothetical protein VGM39_25350 [Kofleriaceae bacterium]
MRFVSVLVLVAGCGFQVNGGAASGDNAPGDDQPGSDSGPETGSDSGSDEPPPAPIDIAHVSSTDEAALTSTFDWTVSANQTLDTSTMTATPAFPSGVVMTAVDQENGGTGLLIVQAKNVHIASGATFRVTGSRVLVLVGSASISIDGTLDASAELGTPGPGGAGASDGAGAGVDAISHASQFGFDTGGGGASFGTVGAKGGSVGNPTVNAPATGPVYGDATLTRLVGGSGGGDAHPTACNVKGGAGGGAVQLSTHALHIAGSVRANGGGGAGGVVCDNSNSPIANDSGNSDAASGGGGGSGGAIFIQADQLDGGGWLVANGGGGGGGGCVSCMGATSGGAGQNGAANAQVASGGTSPLPESAGLGGAGASSAGAAANGVNGGNGGGGGGAVGRIHYAVSMSGVGAINASPAAQ